MSTRKQQLREAVLGIVLGRESVTYAPNQFGHLALGVAEVLRKRTGESREGGMFQYDPRLESSDEMLVEEIFWDLVVERILTPGLDASNRGFPWFRLHTEAETNLRRIRRK